MSSQFLTDMPKLSVHVAHEPYSYVVWLLHYSPTHKPLRNSNQHFEHLKLTRLLYLKNKTVI